LDCGRYRYEVVSVGSEVEGLGGEISLQASAVARVKISNTAAHPHISDAVHPCKISGLVTDSPFCHNRSLANKYIGWPRMLDGGRSSSQSMSQGNPLIPLSDGGWNFITMGDEDASRPRTLKELMISTAETDVLR